MTRPGTDIRTFLHRFPDNDACLAHLMKIRVGSKSPCPDCGKTGTWRRVSLRSSWRHTCGAIVNPLAGSIFYRSNIPLGIWFYAILLFCNSTHGIRTSHLRKQTGLGLKSTLRMSERIRELFASVERPLIGGGVGKTVNLDTFEVKCISDPGSKSLGSAFVMAVEEGGWIRTVLIADRSEIEIVRQVSFLVARGTRIVTDGHARYRALPEAGLNHVVTKELHEKRSGTGSILPVNEAYRRSLERTMRAYRQVQSASLWRYIAEAEFRFNGAHSQVPLFDELITNAAALFGYDQKSAELDFDRRGKR